MPLYDYQCDTCGHRFEVRQGIKEDPLTTCPQCGSPIRRVIHPVGIVFKGSGFYVTDSRKSSSAAQPAGANGGGGDTAGKGDKGAATPAAKSDNKTPVAAKSGEGATSGGSSTSSASDS